MAGEFELIARHFTGLNGSSTGENPLQLELGVGDDCALLQLPNKTRLAVSTDTLIEGVHFPQGAKPEEVATRALHVSVSDLAAMGAKPLGFTLAISLPSIDEAWLGAFSQGLGAAARHFAIPLVGGDTTAGPLAMTLTVMGSVPRRFALRRDSARTGDQIYVDGALGDGAAALNLMQRQRLDESDFLRRRFYAPEVNLALGQALLGKASAAIDVSDGLLADLGHVLTASGVGAEINVDALPLSPATLQVAGSAPELARGWALNGGDDYRLCVTMPAEHLHDLTLQGFSLTPIGKVVEDPGVQLFDRAGLAFTPPQASGYQHF